MNRTAHSLLGRALRARLLPLSLVIAASLVDAGAARAEEPKIAFVDLQRALNEVEEGASAKNALKKEFEEKQRTLDDKQTALKAKKEEIDARGMMMKPEVKQEKLAELQKDLMEVQQMYFQMQQELTAKESEVTGTIFQKMGIILQTMGREEDYVLIVEKQSVLYAKNHMDLTNELIRRYNKAYPLKKTDEKKK